MTETAPDVEQHARATDSVTLLLRSVHDGNDAVFADVLRTLDSGADAVMLSAACILFAGTFGAAPLALPELSAVAARCLGCGQGSGDALDDEDISDMLDVVSMLNQSTVTGVSAGTEYSRTSLALAYYFLLTVDEREYSGSFDTRLARSLLAVLSARTGEHAGRVQVAAALAGDPAAYATAAADDADLPAQQKQLLYTVELLRALRRSSLYSDMTAGAAAAAASDTVAAVSPVSRDAVTALVECIDTGMKLNFSLVAQSGAAVAAGLALAAAGSADGAAAVIAEAESGLLF